jgi:transcriptional regulator with XRE-family HTH domain
MSRFPGFADRLQFRLHTLQLQQADIARHIAVPRSTVSRWVCEGRLPPEPLLIRLAKLLDTSPCWLLFGDAGCSCHEPVLEPRLAYATQSLRHLAHRHGTRGSRWKRMEMLLAALLEEPDDR